MLHYKLIRLALSFTPLHDRFEGAKEIFNESKAQWESAVQVAKEEEKNRLALSIPSFPQGTLGPLVPYAPSGISFVWIANLGTGANGEVSKVQQAGTARIYAQKVIRIPEPRLKAHIKKQVENEVTIMAKLPHLHIASIVFHVQEKETHTIIMLPVADHDLYRFLQRECVEKSFPRSEIRHLTSWFGCLVAALAFAHSRSVIHDDIKPTNILIKDHQPYLADFGCAQDFSELEGSTSTDVLQFGTPVYWAPEQPPRGRAGDVFSLGCVFSEMLTVRAGRTLEEYQRFRYQANRDNPYAFRENLPKVHEWLDQLAQSIGAKDEVGELLIEQTRAMLEPNRTKRVESKMVQKRLRAEGDAVFCSTCQW